MYTVNNTNFFDFGVDAGDAQLMVDGISIGFLQLLTPIQLFERFQRTLFVSQLCILFHLMQDPFIMILGTSVLFSWVASFYLCDYSPGVMKF